jgi:DNA-binding NtrC family response regulator
MALLRILIVDDDVNGIEPLRLTLEDAGYEVHEAYDGRDGLGVMHMTPCHVVLTDFHMPHMNGLQLLHIIRRSWPDTSVIMLSGGPTDAARVAAKLGAYAWIQKPYEVHHLLHIVGKATEWVGHSKATDIADRVTL